MEMTNKVRGFEKAVKARSVNADGNEVVEYWDTELPVRSTKKAAGYDFYAAEDVNIPSVWGPLLTRIFIRHTEEGKSENETHRLYLRKNYTGETQEEKAEAKEKVRGKFAPILVHTGVKAYMMDDEVLYICNRSGNPGKLGLVLANSIGVIDSDYYGNEKNDGEIMFAFYNLFPFPVTIKKGTRIGQGIFQKFLITDGDRAEGIRAGGFGSTEGHGVTKDNFASTAQSLIDKAQQFVSNVGEQLESAFNSTSGEIASGMDDVMNGVHNASGVDGAVSTECANSSFTTNDTIQDEVYPPQLG